MDDEVTRDPAVAQDWYDQDGSVVTDCVECGGTLHTFGRLPVICPECGDHPLTYQREAE
jgi:predicted RNA-binding Zn-ribbon protein involved in translation (DUF1610 family)